MNPQSLTNAVRTVCLSSTTNPVASRRPSLKFRRHCQRPDELANRLSAGRYDTYQLTAAVCLHKHRVTPAIHARLDHGWGATCWTLSPVEAATMAAILTAQNANPDSLRAAQNLRLAVEQAERAVADVHAQQRAGL